MQTIGPFNGESLYVDVSPNTDLCINQFAESPSSFDSQSMGRTSLTCGSQKLLVVSMVVVLLRVGCVGTITFIIK